MRIENTLENKAKFFALYWDKEIVKDKILINENPMYISECIEMRGSVLEYLYIELTPLSQITDEDLKHIVILTGYDFIASEEIKNLMIGKDNYWMEYFKGYEVYVVIQYLISKGYYVGDCTEIEWGWVKLKEALK